MAGSGWGNAFASLGESADKRRQLALEEKIRQQEQADKQRQFDLMSKQFLAGQDQQKLQNQMQAAKIQSENIMPDAAGSAGSLSLNDPRLKAFEGPGSVYSRAEPGKFLASSTQNFTPEGAPAGVTQNAPKPSGKFTWKPSWEQQQTIDEGLQKDKAFGLQEQQAADQHKITERTLGQPGWLEQQKVEHSNRLQEIQMQGAQSLAAAKLTLGNRLTPEQTILMNGYERHLSHPPRVNPLTGEMDPAEVKTFEERAKQYEMAMGINLNPNSNDMGPQEPAPATPDNPLGVPGFGAPTAPVAPGGGGFDPSRFLSNPDIQSGVGVEGMGIGQGGSLNGGQPLTWEQIDRIMRERFPNTGNWNPTTMGRDIHKRY